jgi:protein-arginine kinase activator protein McsA
MLTKPASRKRAQRAFPTPTACEHCGSTSHLQRHHPNLQDATSVVILCQTCHAAEHVRLGTWGQGSKKPKTCVVCGTEFSDYSHVRVKTCSPTCLSELGRRNARKRWGNAMTDLAPSATPSSPRSPNS